MDLIQEMGIKELEQVVLKAHEDITIGSMEFEAGEPILYFKNLQIAQLTESSSIKAARGGFLNQPLVVWEDRSDVTFQLSNGTINQLSLNLLLEADTLQQKLVYVPFQEQVVLDDRGQAYLSHLPVYDRKRFYKICEANNLQERVFPTEDNQLITLGRDYADKTVSADYYFLPDNQPLTYCMNRERRANLYTLEATFYLKDENEGLLHTGILEMPKVYITSNINLRMGERADPTVGTFRIVAMPETTDDYEALVCRVSYLDEDIYGL